MIPKSSCRRARWDGFGELWAEKNGFVAIGMLGALLGGGQGNYRSLGNLEYQLWVEWGWDGDETSRDSWIGLQAAQAYGQSQSNRKFWGFGKSSKH